MAIQFRIDDVIDNNDGTVTFQIGPYGITKDKIWLFDRSSFELQHLIKNMRMAYNIGTKPLLASREFLDTVNGGQKGIDLADGTWFIRSVTLKSNGTDEYEVGFAQSKNGPISYTTTLTASDITQSTSENPEDIFDNVKSFLRLGNFSDLTTAAKNALKGRVFWA